MAKYNKYTRNKFTEDLHEDGLFSLGSEGRNIASKDQKDKMLVLLLENRDRTDT